MAATLQVEGWEATGLRCPDHTFSFLIKKGRVAPITLIQMPNGTGKTTTLDLLRASLSGEAGEWDDAKVREYRKEGHGGDTGHFILKLLLPENHRLTIEMRFDFEGGIVRYSTTMTTRGKEKGFRPPRHLSRFLCPDFVPFFVLDGELANRLLDAGYADAQMAVRTLYQLQLLHHMAEGVERYWDEQTSGLATDKKALTQRQNKVDSLHKLLKKRKKEEADTKAKYQQAKEKLQKKKTQFAADLAKQKEIGLKLEEGRECLSTASAAVKEKSRAVMQSFRDVHGLSSAFAAEIADLKGSLDKAKLPESTAREFFEELAKEDLCVCGSILTDATREVIRQRAKHYLGSEDVAFLNTMKTSVAAAVGSDPEQPEKDLQSLVDELGKATEAEAEARTDLDELTAKGVHSDPKLEQAIKEIHDLEQVVVELEEELARYDDASEDEDDEDTYSIKVLKERLDEAEKKLGEISGTLELKEKRDILVPLLQASLKKASDELSEEIRDKANQRIAHLMPHNAVRIKSVGTHVVLQNKASGSTGENLAVGYAFLATLFDQPEHKLPFIVDSPAGPIDMSIRKNAARLFPQLSHQLIAFTISTERDGFLDPLEKAMSKLGKNIQYLTMFRKGRPGLDASAAKEKDVKESDDGLWVSGRSFFENFQLEDEDDDAV